MSILNKYGCGCRCLLRALELRHAPISESDFLARFRSRFPAQSVGITDTALLCDLARELGLAQGVQVLRDFDTVREWLTSKRAHTTLVCVERFPDNKDVLGVLYHAMLLTQISEVSFSLWSPTQDGGAQEIQSIAKSEWDRFLTHALLLT